MCCRRRSQPHQPTLLTASRTILNAFQNHTNRQHTLHTTPQQTTTNIQNPAMAQINTEVLKNANIDPPPYTSVVMNRGAAPPLYEPCPQDHHTPSAGERAVLMGSRPDRVDSMDENSRESPSRGLPVWQTKRELKAAYKAARRSEKVFYKAEREALKAERKGARGGK